MDLKESGLGAQIAEIVNAYGMETHMIASCRSMDSVADIAANLPGTTRQVLQDQPSTYDDSYWEEQVSAGTIFLWYP